ncbi:MAG: hypothetical protein R3D34_09020 [Nitratireductor sp.]
MTAAADSLQKSTSGPRTSGSILSASGERLTSAIDVRALSIQNSLAEGQQRIVSKL